MTDTKCTWCTQHVAPGLVLCGKCVTTLERALGNVATYHADLDTIREKRARYGGTASKGSIGKAQPLPVDGRFLDRIGRGSQLEWDCRNTVAAWARVVLEEHPPVREQQPRDTVASVCGWLGQQRNWIAGQMWATDMLDEVLDLERRLRRFVDRPAEREFIGKCGADADDPNGPCMAELYAQPGATLAQCEACGTEHTVDDRREFLLEQARTYAVTATEAAGALCAWTDYDGSTVKLVDLIRKWAEPTKMRPARLFAIGHIEHLGRERALYRLGEIEVLLRGHVQERRLKTTA